MYTVKCSHCGRSLTTPKAVTQAKIRCPACGQVFVGTTQPVGESAAPSAAGAQKRPAGPPPAKRPGAPAPAAPARPESPDDVRPAAPAPVPAPAATPAPPRAQPKSATASLAEAAKVEAAPAAAQPAVRVVYRRKSNKGLYVGVVTGVLGVLLVVGVVVAFMFAGTKRVKIRQPDGSEIVVRMTQEQIDEMNRKEAEKQAQEEQKKREQEQARDKALMAAAAAKRNTPTEGQGVDPHLRLTDLNSQTQPSGSPPPVPEISALPTDPKIVSVTIKAVPMTASTNVGDVVGEVSSHYDQAIRELQLTPQVIDSSGRVVGTLPSCAVQYVPVNGTVRYTTKFRGIEADSIEKAALPAKVTLMPKDEVVYKADVDPFDPKTMTVRGVARNEGSKALTDAFVYIELYTRDDVFIASARAELEEGNRLAPGVSKAKRFSVELKADDYPEPDRIFKAQARVVGKEE